MFHIYISEFLHFLLLSFKDVCTTEKGISCILLDDDYFLQGLPLSWHVQQLPGGVCSLFTCLRIDLFRARYFEKMPYHVPFLWY